MPMIFTNAGDDNAIVFANDSFLALSGYSGDEVLGRGFTSLIGRSADPKERAEIEAAFASDSANAPEVQFRCKNDSQLWLSIFVAPVRNGDGTIVQHFVSFVELTRHKRAENEFRMLIDVLDYSGKNTLATVQSTVSKALRSPDDVQVMHEAIETVCSRCPLAWLPPDPESRESAELYDIVADSLESFSIAEGRAQRSSFPVRIVASTQGRSRSRGRVQ